MNDLFEKNGFLVIKNFITKSRAKKLSKEFVEFCDKNPHECTSDPQVPGTPAKHNYTSFLELLCEKTPEVSKILDETVLPTYCYSRVYKNSDILEKHTDRDECEISLTVHLDGDQEWNICLEDLNGNSQAFNLNSGDALIYSGCIVPHWRDEYKGNFYSQVFLHYVRSKGSKSGCYFDRGKASDKNLKDHIHVIDDVLSEDFCDLIVNRYLNSNEWSDSQVGVEGNVDKLIRNCKIINITLDSNSKDIDNQLFLSVDKIFKYLAENYIHLSLKQDSGYEILKYTEGGFYTEHVDSFEGHYRVMSCSICLNDDYEGGEFSFFGHSLNYKPKKGSAIVFPSNFMFPHQILPVTKGTRYSVITWFV